MKKYYKYKDGDTVKREVVKRMILNSYNNLDAYLLETQGKSPEEIIKEVVFN